jgi:SAM-dependent methyltransferase
MRAQNYDRIGHDYARKRVADPRLASEIRRALGSAKLVLNVGAGAGSYEPEGCQVVGLEPALTMVRQRPASAGPAVRGLAENLPFSDKAFDVAVAILTIHHWTDWRAGLREMARTAGRVVIFTWDPAAAFWLRDYLPALWAVDRRKFPEPSAIASFFSGGRVDPFPIPADCTDGFLGAYWRRPSAYLSPDIRASISSMASGDGALGLDQLAADLSSGHWRTKYESILAREELDVGYRLIACDVPPNPMSQRKS